MGKLVVPSDITLLEEQQQEGVRELSILEKIGLLFIPPVYNINNYNKLNKKQIKNILIKKYNYNCIDTATDICRRRQESVRKRVLVQNGVWIGGLLSPLLINYSLRHYDLKTKIICLPFAVYGGSILGRFIAAGIVGRWKEWGRDRALGSIPAVVVYAEQK